MKTLEITTAIGCPMMCKFCPQGKLITNYGDNQKLMMDLEEFKQAINKVPKHVRIDFSGMCEPFKNPECADMMLYASNRGHKVAVYTTLDGCTLKDLALIKNIKFDDFVLHLPDQNRSANIPICPDYMTALNTCVEFGMVSDAMCMGPIDNRIAHIVCGSIIPMHNRAGSLDIIPSTRRKGKLLCRGNPRPEVGGLLPNGDVYLCCMDYGLKHKLGNLYTQSYKDLYTSEEYNKVIAAMDSEDGECICRMCDYTK